MSAVYDWFYHYACVVEAKIPRDDPNAERSPFLSISFSHSLLVIRILTHPFVCFFLSPLNRTMAIVKKIKEICQAHTGPSTAGYGITEIILGAAVTASAGYLVHRFYTSR